MAPVLKVLFPKAGTTYPPTEPIRVNSTRPNKIKNEHFEGELSMWIKDYNGLKNKGEEDAYFGQEGRQSSTYAIVVKGTYLEPISADDILFGNVFEKPIRDSLPWGTSIAMKFISWVDPTVEMDAYSDKPWALAPISASMNYLSILPKPTAASTSTIITEQTFPAISKLHSKGNSNSKTASTEPIEWADGTATGIAARRKWLTNKGNRQSIVLDKEWQMGGEFGNGLIDFKTLHVVLPQPFPLRIPLLKYWDGQPATYICKSRDGKKIFWSIAIQIESVDDKDIEAHMSEDDSDGEADDVEPSVSSKPNGKVEKVIIEDNDDVD